MAFCVRVTRASSSGFSTGISQFKSVSSKKLGGGHDGHEFAVYTWKGPFNKAWQQAQTKLKGWKLYKSRNSDFVSFDDQSGIQIGFMSTRLTQGKITMRDKYDIPDQNSVTVMISRALPHSLVNEIRVSTFSTRL